MLCGKGGLHQNILNNPLNEYNVFEEIVFIAIKIARVSVNVLF